MSIATRYERVNPNEEKLKRLYNCPRMTENDQKYLNTLDGNEANLFSSMIYAKDAQNENKFKRKSD